MVACPICLGFAFNAREDSDAHKYFGLAQFLLLDPGMSEQMQRAPAQGPWERKAGDEGGPKTPDVSKPDTNSLLKRLRSIDPDQSRKYRQRSGQ